MATVGPMFVSFFLVFEIRKIKDSRMVFGMTKTFVKPSIFCTGLKSLSSKNLSQAVNLKIIFLFVQENLLSFTFLLIRF